jgi:hypothetical protein
MEARAVPRKSILVAAADEVEERLRRVLTGHELIAARTLSKAGNARLKRIIDYLILIDGELHQGLDGG